MKGGLQSSVWQTLFFASALSHLVAGTEQNDVCTTAECVRSAAHVLGNFDPKYTEIDPCEDFDQYVCGGFPTQYPNGRDSDILTNVGIANSYVVRDILESPYPGSNSSSSGDDKRIFDMVVKNYQACMNLAPNESDGVKGLTAIIGQVAQRFPVSMNTSAVNETLKEQDMDAYADTLAYLAGVGVNIFGEFWTLADPQNPDVLIPRFGYNLYNTSDRALPARILISELLLTPPVALTPIVKLLYSDSISNASAAALAGRVLEFATAFATIELTSLATTSAGDFYYTTTIANATKIAPALALDKVVQKLAPAGYKQDRMVFQFAEPFGNVSTLIASTSKSTLQALMMVMTYKSYEQFLPDATTGTNEETRWGECFDYIDTSLPWIASKFFLDRQYNNQIRSEFKTMAEDLKTAFSKRVDKLDWMANNTKTLVQDKISKVKTLIGYPDENPNTRNASDLLKYYSPINITTSHFSNAVSIRQWAAKRAFAALSFPVDTDQWLEFGVHSYTANARYYFNQNNMHVPAGISQHPLFFEGSPSYLIYGGIGMVAGHEITHGFDINGRQWDNNRRYKEWWDKSSETAFNNRTACFVEQFSSIPVVNAAGHPVLNETKQQAYVNGTTTLAENLADNGGLANAYDAWKIHEAKTPSQKLPGLEKFTKEQLFFVAAGQTWCSKTSTAGVLETVKGNEHAPAFARILNIQFNSRGFREAFQCKVKEPECQLW